MSGHIPARARAPEPAVAVEDWPLTGLADDVRPWMYAAADRSEALALATIIAADGGGPRGVGAQLVVTRGQTAGYLSNGCIDADVALHAKDVLASGMPVRLVYGRDSPFADIRLPCGGQIVVLVERIAPSDGTVQALRLHERRREPASYRSDGVSRSVTRADEEGPGRSHGGQTVRIVYAPRQRLVVLGHDPYSLAMLSLGKAMGWDCTLVRPLGPTPPPPLAVAYDTRSPRPALAALEPDRQTAIVVALHDLDLDHEALAFSLASPAGYVGLMGSRRRLADRLTRLHDSGVSQADLARLKAPVGLAIGGRLPFEVAASVIAEIVEVRRAGGYG